MLWLMSVSKLLLFEQDAPVSKLQYLKDLARQSYDLYGHNNLTRLRLSNNTNWILSHRDFYLILLQADIFFVVDHSHREERYLLGQYLANQIQPTPALRCRDLVPRTIFLGGIRQDYIAHSPDKHQNSNSQHHRG